jgi:pimeloyl-ACP methyl ester carboxylesterase
MLTAVGKDIWLEVDGLRIHCFEAGESGSPIMLLYGGGVDSAHLSWGRVIGPLSDHHRVFAPDFPGYGQSDSLIFSTRWIFTSLSWLTCSTS